MLMLSMRFALLGSPEPEHEPRIENREARTPLSRSRQFFFQQLPPVEIRIKAVAGHQLVVASALDDAAVVEDENQVGAADGRDAVRHDDRGALPHYPAEAVEDLLLRVRIHGRER